MLVTSPCNNQPGSERIIQVVKQKEEKYKSLNADQMKKPDKKNIENILGLTPTQEGILFHYLKDPAGTQYSEQLCLHISGGIDVGWFKKAWDVVTKTNEMLRTQFRWKKLEKPVQIILKEHKCDLRIYDLTDKNNRQKKAALEEIKARDRQKTLDPARVPFRVSLCRIAGNKYRLIISNHHILYDGWSTGIILKEFFNAYHALAGGNQPVTPLAKPSFKEFIRWRQNQDKTNRERFWKEYLAGFDNSTALPIKKRRKKAGEIKGSGSYTVSLPRSTKDRLEVFLKQHRATMASFFYSAWGILLQRYCNTEEVIFGTTVSGRSAPIKGLQDMVGLFINTIPLRIKTGIGETIKDLLCRVNDSLSIREKYESTPLVDIKEYSQVASHVDLFDSLVVMENYPLDQSLMRKDSRLPLVVESYSIVESTHYDLGISITIGEVIGIDFIYNPNSLEESNISRLSSHFNNIIEYILIDPGNEIFQIEMLSAEEKKQVLYDFNDTEAAYPQNKTIHGLFAGQAEKTPDHTALVGKEEGWKGRRVEGKKEEGEKEGENSLRAKSQELRAITYKESNEKSHRLAYLLREKGVEADSIVGIMMERSVEMVIGILGILKAGGAYLPIDPGYPEERITYMLKDSNAQVLVVDDTTRTSWLSFAPKALLDLSEGHHLNFLASQLPSFPASLPSSLAYVLYTSGSTGKPKGVMVEHASVVNILWAMQTRYPLGPADVYLLKTAYVFDVSAVELFGWFLGGGRLAILEKGAAKDPEKILDAIDRLGVTHINFVPSMFNGFVEGLNPGNIDKLSALKYIFLAGEVLLPGLVNKFKRFNTTIALENIYGPTEGTVYTTFYSLSLWEGAGSIPIGKPLSNVTVYILDRYNHLQPPGIIGELVISGAGVARGYLDNPGLTAEKFDQDLWNYRDYQDKRKKVPGKKNSQKNRSYIFYKTGDLARWLPDGNIEFEGRIDYQVKIRGFRIELGEIENRLLAHKSIKEALVMAKKDQTGESYLCGYIAAEKELDISQLRQYLSQKLPGYMVPSYFVSLEKMPLTPSGKIDRNLLPDPRGFRPPLKGIYTAPKNEVEKTIANTWKEVLGLDKVGVDDNFFDIGGHSLHMIRVNTRLQKVFEKDIPMAVLFKYPTVRSLANYFTGNEPEKAGSMKPLEKRDKKKIEEKKKRIGLGIAVIGMACRFPAAKNCDEFRDNLKNGVESISFLTKEELIKAGADPGLVTHPDYVAAKGILADKNHFDAAFFNYTPAEAGIMDPQVRIFHECCWEALEDAGYNPMTYEGNIGLYAGASPNPYWEILPLKLKPGNSGPVYPYAEQWNAVQFSDKDYLSTRIAYKLDLKGACVTMQTACSTSLVAVDLACQGLLSRTCDIALAGGVSITFFDEAGYLYQEGTIMSPDGHCRSFDTRANGTVGGNGAGLVVLKRLEDAIENRDNIYAVIKGSGINNDGKNKVGFTAPSVEGQAKAIGAALQMAGVEPGSIGYIEAHGTGTPLGDPIEIEALKQAFPAAASETKNYCALGSVKTNIGHLDAAAGIAGLIKTVSMLKHRFIPPSLHFHQPNPAIDFENSPFYVNTQLLEWKNARYPLRAGVSSFGLGGTNAHVILEEAPEFRGQTTEDREQSQGRGGVSPPAQSRQHQLILLSAKSETALEQITQNLAHHFQKHPDIQLADAAYTLQVGREVFPHRGIAVCSTNNAREAAHALDSRVLETGIAAGEKPTIIFMFSGQGSQYIDMGLDLYQKEPGFRNLVDRCFKRVEDITGKNMKPVLYPDLNTAISPPVPPEHPSQEGNRRARAEKKIYQFRYTTPIKFIFEYSLASLLMEWGITPDAMIGHSFGEYVAACLSGVFSLEDALFLAVWRGELMHRLPPGAMLGVPLSEKELEPILSETDELSLAAVNGESLGVVSGTINAIDALEKKLNDQGRETVRFRVPRAGHSWMVEPILEEFREKIKGIQFKEPQIPYISGLTGKWITAAEAMNPGYWTRHLRETIRFAHGLTTLFKEPNPIFLQVGPDRGLTLFVDQHPDKTPNTLALNLVRHRKEKIPDDYYCLKKIGQLWLRGIPIDGQEFHSFQKCRRISLPTYPFESKCFNPPKNLSRIEVDTNDNDTKGSSAKPLLTQKTDMADWFYIPLWEQSPLPPLSITKSPITRESVNWLVFLDDLGLGLRLVKELKKTAGEVVTVKAGKSYARGSDNSYTLNPGQPHDYNRLFHHLKESGRVPHKILHLWSVMDNGKLGAGLKELDRIQESGFYSLLNIAQAVGQEKISEEMQIKAVSNNMQNVTGEEDTRPEKATIRGAVKIIPLEYVNISCTSIDILLSGAGQQIKDKLVQQLLNEIMVEAGSPGSDHIIALRGNRRWRESMKPLRLEETGQLKQRLEERGIYLITGGFGGMGFTLARYLAQNFRARLILVGRSDFPARKNWPQWLAAHAGDDNVTLKIRKIQELEQMGAEIMVCSADVSNEQQMQAVIAKVHQRFGLIDGVLHTAGVGDYAGVIQQRTREMTEQVMAPKVKGTLVLEAVLKDDHPDFLVLFSSIGNIIYPIKFGQVGYSAANEFLEAFAYYKTGKDGTHTLTINWNDWLEVGMSIEATNRKYQRQWKHKYVNDTSEIDYEAAIHGGIRPAQGVEVFRRILGCGRTLERVTVSMVDLEEMVQALTALTGLTGLRSSKGEGTITFEAIEEQALPTQMGQRPHLRTPYAAPTNLVEETLSKIWSNYFGIKPIGREDDFFELGGDSLKAMIMIQKIHKDLGVRIPLADFFNNPTVRGQAGYIFQGEKRGYAVLRRAEKKEYYPLSSAQQRIYILHNMEERSISYNITHAIQLSGEIDRGRIEEVFRQIIKRQESLRTSFQMVGGQPVQRVHEDVEFAIENKKFCGGPGGGFSKEPPGQKPFDLSKAPLLRVELSRIDDRQYIFILQMHHIIGDGTSIDVLTKEFSALYTGGVLPALPIQYKDYSQWRVQEQKKTQESYWLEQLSGELPVLDLPIDNPRPVVQGFVGSRLDFGISAEETHSLKTLALAADTTLFTVLLGICNTWIARLSGQEDIIIGTVTAGRESEELRPLIGMFVNTLALRNFPGGEKDFRRFLAEVRAGTLTAFENQDYPFEELVEKLAVARDTGRNPLFDVMFILQTRDNTPRQLPGLTQEPIQVETGISRFDLTLEAVEEENRLNFTVEYCAALFKKETIARYIRYFTGIVSALIKEPGLRLSEIEILSKEEKKQVLYDFSGTVGSNPQEKLIHDWFEEKVEQSPDRIALVGQSDLSGLSYISITYCELKKQSDRLAHLLIEKGVLPDHIVGIMMERSVEMVIGILGILKAGGAYMPIDPGNPGERINYMLKDSGTKILVTTGDIESVINRTYLSYMSYNVKEIPATSLAYIIYTSGSTGKPKGVMMGHRPVVNVLKVMQERYPILETDVYLLKTPVVFDVSVTELFGWYLGGGRLAILEQGAEKDPQKIVETLPVVGVTHINFVPSLFKTFIALLNRENIGHLSGLKYIFLAGEALPPGIVAQFRSFNTSIALENLYGPTESAVYSSWYALSEWTGSGKIAIGKPLPNVRLLVLDRYDRLQPVGVPGELCTAGAGLARGYLNRPELTKEKFIFYRSYRSYMTYISKKLYKSGDLARWLPDGNLEFLGRIDYQVKIRGNRIELGEIENRLLKYDPVKEAVLVVKEDGGGDKYLVAYIVVRKGEDFSVTGLRAYLAGALPDYMIPAYFVEIDRIPLGPSGKIDRRALPEPKPGYEQKYTAPRDERERKLAEIWSEVLSWRSPMGIDTNFFVSGGHSLKAAVMAAEIHKAFDVKLPLSEIFKNPTIRQLSVVIKGMAREYYAPIDPVEAREYYLLSSAQKRIYVTQRKEEASTVYNMPFLLRWAGSPDPGRLEKAFKELVRRHESLRTSFLAIEGEPVQRVHDQVSSPIEIETITREFIRPFNLSQAPLIRVGMVNAGPYLYILLVDMHHIISDGISCEILLREFTALYAGERLPGIRLQYRDYSGWQRREKHGEALGQQENYWKRQLSGELPVMELPTDFPWPAVQTFEGSDEAFEIGKEATAAINALALAEAATPFMVWQAIYTIFLSKICGQEDIIVGTPTAGRGHPDLEPIIGMFVNTLVLRNYPCSEKSFPVFLREVKERSLEAFENQEYPYEELVDQVLATSARETSRNPIFDTMFTLRDPGKPGPRIREVDLELTPFDNRDKTSKFDLLLIGEETGEKVSFTFEYSTRLFTGTRIRRFIGYFCKIVAAVIGNPGIKLAEIEIISAEEKRRILEEFNDTGREYPRDKTIHELFKEQAQEKPDCIALAGQSDQSDLSCISITYRELNERSGKLAGLLIEKGVQPETVVGIREERSVAMIIGLLGILEAGGAYLPIDPQYPEERQRQMMKDSAAKLLVTNLAASPSTLILPSTSTCQVSPTNLAYIIYTSGSMGKPKGVMVEHRNVVRLVKNTDYVEFKENQGILPTGALEFDASTFEIWGAMLNGLTLYLVEKGQILNPERLKETIKKYHIGTIWMTSPLFNQMVLADEEIFAGLTHLLVGGDALSPSHISRVRTKFPALKVINGYGPTENTTFSTTFLIDKEYDAGIPIGTPISNSTAYIVNRDFHLQPVGVTGELYVGGDGVSRGYLNDPELTEEKFIENYFYRSNRSYRSYISMRVYKTGDMARWLPEGNIEFLGRIDNQVKLRGFRVEPGEIENRLLSRKGIKDAVVIVKQNQNQEKYLCAYVVPFSGNSQAGAPSLAAELKSHLQGTLPNYMVPAYFILLDRLPLTPNGKIDREALPEPGVPGPGGPAAAMQNATQEKLALIWSEVLSIPSSRLSMDSDFFQLGGHSLNALQVLNALQKEFKAKMEFQDIFQYPTIAELGQYIREKRDTAGEIIENQPEKAYYSLSYAQKRLWMLYQLEPGNSAFNLPTRITLKCLVEEAAVRKALEKLVQRHESFRTYFKPFKGSIVQRIQSHLQVNLDTYDLSEWESQARDEKRDRLLKEESLHPFNLETPPLFRLKLIKCGDEEFDVILTMHHVITDGWSLEVLEREFRRLYETYKTGGECDLEPLKNRYIDYVYWQERHLADKEKMHGARGFWKKQLQGEYPVLDLPYDYPKKNMKSKKSAANGLVIPVEVGMDLKKIARDHKASLFMILLAGYYLLLYRLTGQEDILLAIPGAARQHDDLKNIVGFFVNTLVLREKINPGETFIDFLSRVQHHTLQVLEYQSYPMELLCSECKTRYPDISVFFNMLTFGNMEQEDIQSEPSYHLETVQEAKFDMVCYLGEFKKGIRIETHYYRELFEPRTIERIMQLYGVILEDICRDPRKKIGEYHYSLSQKKRKLAYFN